GNIPTAYAYPKGLRETRDLLRRRTYFVRQRAALLTHTKIVNAQYNLPPLTKEFGYARDRGAANVAGHFPDGSVRQSIQTNLALINALDEQIACLERYLERTAKIEDPQTYQLLQTIPGVGKILGLILLYEIHRIQRFPETGDLLSYARLVRCVHKSAGKT